MGAVVVSVMPRGVPLGQGVWGQGRDCSRGSHTLCAPRGLGLSPWGMVAPQGNSSETLAGGPLSLLPIGIKYVTEYL